MQSSVRWSRKRWPGPEPIAKPLIANLGQPQPPSPSPTINTVQQTLADPREQGRAARPPLDAPAPLRLWHLASLDAPTVAVTWTMGFAWAARIRLPGWVPALVALTAWTVYIADRLLDALRGLHSGDIHRLRARHFFHWRHRWLLAPLAVAAAIAAFAIVFVLMPPGARERNSVLAAAALAYFSGVHSGRSLPRLRFPAKEFLVAVLFTAGCALPALSRLRAAGGHTLPSWPLLVLIAFFAALAWLNCHAIERWESAPKLSEKPQILPLAGLLALLGMSLAAVLSLTLPRATALVAAGTASALLLALLDRLRNRLSPLALRAAADLVLLTPILLIPFCPLLR
jgi:hypothetical protein